MKITEKENGTFYIHSENELESQVINIIFEMAHLAYMNGEMSDDDINDHGCLAKDGMFLNYCTIPGMKMVEKIIASMDK